MTESFQWAYPPGVNRCDDAGEEILRIHEEVNEAFFALRREPAWRALAELEDVKHNAETAQRMIVEQHGIEPEELWRVKQVVLEGNRRRGYYG